MAHGASSTARKAWRRPPTSPIEALFWDGAKPQIPDLQREVEIGPYRVDFLVARVNLVIELYGYKWHADQEKRIRDAVRERDLLRAGYRVMSFMGAEVTRNRDGCVRETLRVVEALSREMAPPSVTQTTTIAVPIAHAQSATSDAAPPAVAPAPPDSSRPAVWPARRKTRAGLKPVQIVIVTGLGALVVSASLALGALLGYALSAMG